MATPLLDNRQLGPDTARANLLVNGGFEVWQRGNGPFVGTVPGVYCADRWNAGTAGTDALSVSKDQSNYDGSGNTCAACTFTLGSGAGATNLIQQFRPFDTGSLIVSRTVSVSVRVRVNVANAIRIGFYNGSAWAYSAFHTGDGTYQTLSMTATVAGASQLSIFFAASCTAYLDNAMLVVGEQAANYAPLHPADDLARCLRYYEIFSNAGTSNGMFFIGFAYSTSSGQIIVPYKATKAVSPTITLSAGSTFALANSGGTPQAASGTSIYGSYVDHGHLNVAAGGLVAGNATALTANGAAAATIAVEANP